MSEQVDLKRCARCGSWMPDVATMCASCGTSDVDGARAGVTAPARRPARDLQLPTGWTVTRILIWMNALYLLWCLRVQFAFSPDAGVTASLLSFSGLNQGLYYTGSYVAPLVESGQWWRVFTAFFLHGGIFHIGMNMWVLARVGNLLEELIGPWRFATIYLVSGISSTLAITIWFVWTQHIPNPNPMVGASGAVFGVLGALAMFALRSGTGQGRQMGRVLIRDIGFMLILGWVVPMISNTGHVGGLLPGLAFGLVVRERFADRLNPGAQRGWMFATLVLFAATGVALAHGVGFSLQAMGSLR